MTLSAIIGIALAVLILLGGPIFAASKRAYAFVSTRISRLPSFAGLFDVKIELPLWKVVALVAVLWLVSGGVTWPGCKLPAWPSWPSLVVKPDAVTYVHVVKGVVPGPVIEALNELSRKEIVATPYPADTTDGDGQIPDQYKIQNDKAKEAGLPSLVVMSKGKFVRLVKDPKTKEQVMEAAQ